MTLPHDQQAIRAKCFHPSGTFDEFRREELEQSIPERFERIVQLYPDRIAVKTGDQAWTYAELNASANRIAHAILRQGQEATEPVALVSSHDAAATIAGMLGALKAGKIYVPLDPSHPRARLAAILEDSGAKAILVDKKNLSLAKALPPHSCSLLQIDELNASVSTDNPESPAPDTVACILYTSGSTGQPKGVMQNHRGVLHRVMVDTNSFHICPDDRLSLLSSPSYGVSLRNLYGALLNGASVYLFDVKKEGLTHLAEWLIDEEISIYFSVPTVFRGLVESLAGGMRFTKLRLIYLGGEAVTKKDVELYKKYFCSDCILVNSLASNEAGIIRQYFISKTTEIKGNVVFAGYEVEDKKIVVLDDDGQDLGCDEAGEIAISSSYNFLGYWRRSNLTQSRLLPHPTRGDRRIFRTGDLGRLLSDGCLEHLGRKDFQVKIRGQRVDVSEIEAVLVALGNIKEAAVVAKEDKTQEKYLLAYIVPIQTGFPSIAALRGVLGSQLPDYMVPSRFAIVDAIPKTPNGKVDRLALPEPDNSRPELSATYVAPRTPVERYLAEIWAKILSLTEVGIHDNFFDLGGHSLAATRVVSQVVRTFQLELPLQSLFQSPTVAEMANVILEHQGKKLDEQKLHRMLTELELLSEEDALRLWLDRSRTRGMEE